MDEITINGINTSYIDEGEGKCVLLLHGWGACKESLSPIYNELRNKYRVIVPDLAGFGESMEPPVPWNVHNYSDYVKEFLFKLNIEKPIALGHSNGGRVLIRMASEVEFEKLILVDSAGLKAKHGADYYFKVYSYKSLKTLLKLPLVRKTGLYDRLRKKAGSEDYKNASEIMKQTMSKLLNEDLSLYLPKINVPTLIIWGEKDTATPLCDGQKMEKNIKNSGLVVLKGAGHFSYLDNFGVFIAALKYFLEH